MAASTRASVTKLVPLLERLSLLRINQAALDRVVRCVEFASVIKQVDTSSRSIEPMFSPTEGSNVNLRNDVSQPCSLEETTKNASQLVEDYFVTPSEHKHYSQL